MPDDPRRPVRAPGVIGVAALFALLVLAVLCCAAPLLITSAVLGAAGAWLHSPWLIAAAALAVLTTSAVLIRRRFTAMRDSRVTAEPREHCCAPGQTTAGKPMYVPGPRPSRKPDEAHHKTAD